MKIKLFYVFAFATILLLSSCGNGSSGTAMLDLDVRIKLSKWAQQSFESTTDSEKKQRYEDFSNLFTVLPGPYEFTWEELRNVDGQVGYEWCTTKLKIRLRLNKTLKPGPDPIHPSSGRMMSEEEMIKRIGDLYDFEMFNSEGKTFHELCDENDDNRVLLFTNLSITNIWGVNGKLDSMENKDGLLDFYLFLTGKPGTEFDLIIYCGNYYCKDIEDMIQYNKGLYIEPTSRCQDFRFDN